MHPSPPGRIRDYEIHEEIGRGATSTVFRATHTGLGRVVAIKQMFPRHAGDESFLVRFEREARLAAKIDHPNVVRIDDYFVEDGVAYIVMQYFKRGALDRLSGSVQPKQLLTVLADVLAGLGAAHELGIVHRDLKPANVMRWNRGGVKIGDFGTAKLYVDPEELKLTPQGEWRGTPLYQAPEVMLGEEADARSDLYSLGAIGYELLTGGPPVPQGTLDTPASMEATLLRRVRDDPVPLARRRPDLHIELAAWIDRLLERNPAKRWQTIEEASEALDRAQSASKLEKAPLALDDPSPTVIEQPERVSRFVTWDGVKDIAKRNDVVQHAVTRPTTLAVTAVIFVAALAFEPSLIWLSLLAFAGLVALTIFDRSEAYAARDSAKRRGRHRAF